MKNNYTEKQENIFESIIKIRKEIERLSDLMFTNPDCVTGTLCDLNIFKNKNEYFFSDVSHSHNHSIEGIALFCEPLSKYENPLFRIIPIKKEFIDQLEEFQLFLSDIIKEINNENN